MFGMLPHIFLSINSSPGGTYQQRIAKWWQWGFSVPAAQHPIEKYCPPDPFSYATTMPGVIDSRLA
jgi:hypothetical protein